MGPKPTVGALAAHFRDRAPNVAATYAALLRAGASGLLAFEGPDDQWRPLGGLNPFGPLSVSIAEVEHEGVALIRKIRASYPAIKTMLVSNYAEAQAAAVAEGALPGFGKREIGTPRVNELLRNALKLEQPQP